MAEPKDRDIALCLSGGGLRATLFHFGLIKALSTHTRNDVTALSSVREIYSVSGGSIVAAHLIANWVEFNDRTKFDALEQATLAFARRNIRDRVVRRSLLLRFKGERRGYLLQKEYESLLGSGSIADCYVAQGANRPPKLYILSTSFTTGELCSFSCDGFEMAPNTDADSSHTAPAGHISLAYAVAASSAFPPLFPPVALTADMLRQPEDRRFQETIRLSDGGVFDNVGFEKFQLVHDASALKVKTLMVSNAGGAFHSGLDKTYESVVSRNVRASDILMRRVGDTTERHARSLSGVDFVDVRIGADVDDPVLQPATQKLLRLVRTDLDRFDKTIAGMLIDHGYRVGSACLVKKGWQAPEHPPKPIVTASDKAQADSADRAADRSFWTLWLDSHDWTTVPWIWLLTLLIVVTPFVGAAGIYSVYRAEKIASELRIQKEKRATDAANATAQARKAELDATRLAANKQGDLLQHVSDAVATGDMAKVKFVLTGAIQRTEQLAGSSNGVAASNPPQPDAADVKLMVTDKPAYRIAPPLEPHEQTVSIHFAGILTRAQITALNQGLNSVGWRAQGPSGERTPLAANQNVIRYSGNNLAAAQALADALNAARDTRSGARVVPATITPLADPSIDPGELQVWISH